MKNNFFKDLKEYFLAPSYPHLHTKFYELDLFIQDEYIFHIDFIKINILTKLTIDDKPLKEIKVGSDIAQITYYGYIPKFGKEFIKDIQYTKLSAHRLNRNSYWYIEK